MGGGQGPKGSLCELSEVLTSANPRVLPCMLYAATAAYPLVAVGGFQLTSQLPLPPHSWPCSVPAAFVGA